ncbi:T7SS effector LXG polymorphic toxin [Bacillus sp. CLL-7-23]|uniref:T7SS effector LXG polymorphic toxin n=1 Tax=Bacillus changyiensis TaxID=3004103 RepID=A0ABT4X8J9_9BACI|nr:T7SS effector LXG polymorphic toxin [Bacillus changyiensis]MDA7028614.1 T7SS effector LXG polymorphic toxin [Bacillus changyiensis]
MSSNKKPQKDSSNKVFEANSLIEAADKRKKEYEAFEKRLYTLRKAFLRMTKLDDFQGKAATNIKNFFSGQVEVVDSWILLAKEKVVFFELISYEVKNKKLEDLYVELSFLSQELDNADKTADQVVSSLKSEMDGIIDSIRDVIHLDKWTEKTYHENMSKAQKTRTDTIDAVNELDHYLVSDYQESENMEDVVQEKYKGLIDATSNGKSTEPMNFSLKKFHSSKIYKVSKKREQYAAEYIRLSEQQLAEEKEKERIKRIEALKQKLKNLPKDDEHSDEYLQIAKEIGYNNLTADQQEFVTIAEDCNEFKKDPVKGMLKDGKNVLETMKGFSVGVFDLAKDTAVGAYQTGQFIGYSIDRVSKDPKGAANAVIEYDYSGTFQSMLKSLGDSWNEKMVNGDSYSQGHFLGYAIGSIYGLKGGPSMASTGSKSLIKGANTGAVFLNKSVNSVKRYTPLPKYGPALEGMLQDTRNTINVKNTPLLKKIIEEEKTSVLVKAAPYTYKDPSGVNKTISLKMGHLKNQKHPVTGVPYDKDGFPIFKSKQTLYLKEKDLMKDRTAHFRILNKKLYKKIQNNPKLIEELNLRKRDIAKLKEGKNPKKYTWHHHQEKGRMDLVDRSIHGKTGHTGGYKIWGKDSKK